MGKFIGHCGSNQICSNSFYILRVCVLSSFAGIVHQPQQSDSSPIAVAEWTKRIETDCAVTQQYW